VEEPTVEPRRFARLRAELPILLLVVAIGALCIANQRPGQDWGDDFALYLRQAKAVVEGNIGGVLADNRYTVDESSWHTFSPYSYPWGFPLILAPFYAWRGLDYGVFKLVETVCFGVFLYMFYKLTSKRIGDIASCALVLLLGFSVAYVGWTDTVLSEFPYLAMLGITLWWLDRCRERGDLLGERIRPLIVLGLLIGYTYMVRREGMALFVALAAVHVGEIAPSLHPRRRWRGKLGPALRSLPWRALALPYAAALALVLGMQLILPTVLYQSFPGTGLRQVRPNIIWYRDILAEQLGLKDQGIPGLELAGSESLAKFVFGVFLTTAVLGIGVRALRAWRVDGALIGYLLGVSFIFAVTPFHEGRYLFSITPLLAYFAYHGVAATAALALHKARVAQRAAGAAACAFLMIFVVSNGTDLWHRTDVVLTYGNYVIWGPEDPSAQEMFDAVRTNTRGDDIIGFFRARAMNLYSDRRSVQLTTLEHVLARCDFYVMAKNSTYSQVLVTDEEAAVNGMTKVWENRTFVIWQVPSR
jgi:hypothetical protein